MLLQKERVKSCPHIFAHLARFREPIMPSAHNLIESYGKATLEAVGLAKGLQELLARAFNAQVALPAPPPIAGVEITRKGIHVHRTMKLVKDRSN